MVRRTVWLWAVWCAIGALQSTSGAATPGGELRVLQPDARTSFYVGIAAPASAAAAVHAFNRTLQDISQTYLAEDYPLHLRNITLLPLYIELPEDERFSASVLERACAALGGRRVAALLVCGGGPAASALVAAASRAGVPVVRSSPSHTHFSYTIANELLPLEIRLETTARETLHAIRATLMNTHWHTFTLLAEEDIFTTLSLRKDLSTILSTQPLNPKWLSLPSKYTRRALFRRLAEISRLTRGIVVLICDADYAKLVMDEAKRLNMVEGNFFWLWIDASRDVDVFRNFNNRTHLEEEIVDSLEVDTTNTETIVTRGENKKRIKRDSLDNNTENPYIKSIYKRKKESVLKILFKNLTNLYDDNKITNTNFPNNDTFNANSSSLNKNNYNNNLNVNFKGVATSKVKTKLIGKKNETFFDIDKYKNNNKNNLKSETYSKYVNSINLDEMSYFNENINIEKRSEIKSHVNNEYLSKKKLNPAVHETLQNKTRKKDNVVTDNLPKKKFNSTNKLKEIFDSFPVGLLALHPQPMKTDVIFVQAAVRMIVGSLQRVLRACDTWSAQAQFFNDAVASCWQEPSDVATDFSTEFVREMRLSTAAALAGGTEGPEVSLTASFALLNLVPGRDSDNTWRQVGQVLGRNVRLHTIVWPGGRLVAHGQSASARTIFRIVTALAPPFVMEGELDEDGQCLRGLPCHRPQTSDRDNLTMVFNEFVKEQGQEDAEDFFFPTQNPTGFSKMATHCCYGLAMDLLENIAHELEFDFHLYIVEDGLYGSRKLVKSFHQLREYKSFLNQYIDIQQTPQTSRNVYKYLVDPDDGGADYLQDEGKEEDYEKWNGIMGDLVSGAAHMSFAALSVSSARAEVIDFSQPYFFSGVSILAAPKQKADIPLLAFLLPFSPELWIAIFTSLNVTAIAVAIYEWLSPFGLNPWGRQRSKNFSISSALWVMWGLLCGHLVAFKAPKSWPNKFLINVWGGFSVIFVASYTANIAALIAGLFFHNAVDDFQGRSNWLSLRVGTAKSSIAEYYVQRNNPQLAQQMRRYALQNVEEGIGRLRNGTLDLLIADTPILDYYRATDHGCKLQRVGDHTLAEDTYAIGMTKGFPLKDSISAVIAKYSSNGYMDILTEKWYGGLPCFKLSSDYGIQPKPLGVAAVAGVFLLLGVGMIVGCLILIMEHLFYKYTLPILRHKPNGTIWRSRNIMFFSQKLYRFINCVELVSPHHAARELVNTIKQGHLTSLFQKSVKRKEHEQRRRRKSKAQFFEMIQEIRRVQQESLDSIKEHATMETSVSEQATDSKLMTPSPDVSGRSPRQARSPRPSRSPKQRRKRCSLAGLNVRRFSTDSILGSDSGSIYERTSLNIGRRLSRDVSFLTSSPPDINTRLRTPSPMVRRNEGSSTKSYQDVSDRTDHGNLPNSSSRASIEILISHDEEIPPIPPYPRISVRSNQAKGTEEELIRLWRKSERNVQESLLAALRDRQLDFDSQEDPG